MPAQHLTTLGNIEQIKKALSSEPPLGLSHLRVAMVGRSNVGKSSLINSLLSARLAQVSNTPGKTRVLHFYTWPDIKAVVADLPGYGYAQVAVSERNRWAQVIETYLKEDPLLSLVLVLIDGRNGPTPIDIEAVEFIRGLGCRVLFVMTKHDALKNQSERSRRAREVSDALKPYLDCERVWVSAKTGVGIKELRAKVNQLLNPDSSRRKT